MIDSRSKIGGIKPSFFSKDQGEATWNRWIKAGKKEKDRQKEKKKRFKEVLKAIAEEKTNTIDYKSEEYKKFARKEQKKYNELVAKGEISNSLETIGETTE